MISTPELAGRMRAIAFTARERAELVDWPTDASSLREDEVAGETLATLVSPGTEMQGYRAERSAPGLSGYAAVMRIDAMGDAVRDLRIGDVVFTMGPHASRQRATRQSVVPVPPGLAPAMAVFARLMAVSWATLVTTTARPPDRVLVTGLGPVGNLAAQIFSAAGYRVAAIDPLPARQELARSLGLNETFAAVPTGGEEAQLALECSGHEQAVLDCLNAVRKRGEVALVGVPWQARTDLSAHQLLRAVFHRYVVLRSGWEWELPLHPRDFSIGNTFAVLAGALRWLAEGKVRVEGLAGRHPPSAAGRVWQDLSARRGAPTAVFEWV